MPYPREVNSARATSKLEEAARLGAELRQLATTLGVLDRTVAEPGGKASYVAGIRPAQDYVAQSAFGGAFPGSIQQVVAMGESATVESTTESVGLP